jgi:hypothetical protein
VIAQRSLPRTLGIVLLAQLVLIAITWWPTDPAAHRTRPLLNLERDEITAIEIVRKPPEGDPVPVQLVREAGQWTVRSSAGYPASDDKVEKLLDQLLSIEVSGPVATQPSSHEAFKVSDEEYGRRVDVTAGSEHLSLLLGASTSKSVNIRISGEPEVYHVAGVTEWSFRDVGSSYYDPMYVNADVDQLSSVTVRNDHGTLRFEKQGEAWSLDGLGEGEAADSGKVERFLEMVTRVRMLEPVTETASADHGFEHGVRVDWTVISENQSAVGGYSVGSDVEMGSYVKAVDSAFVVTANRNTFARLRAAERSEFLQPAEPSE